MQYEVWFVPNGRRDGDEAVEMELRLTRDAEQQQQQQEEEEEAAVGLAMVFVQ